MSDCQCCPCTYFVSFSCSGVLKIGNSGAVKASLFPTCSGIQLYSLCPLQEVTPMQILPAAGRNEPFSRDSTVRWNKPFSERIQATRFWCHETVWNLKSPCWWWQQNFVLFHTLKKRKKKSDLRPLSFACIFMSKALLPTLTPLT